jgi:Rod binding domain-containing protein
MEIHGTRDAFGALSAAGSARGDEAARALRLGKDEQAAHAFESFFAQVFVREMRRGLPQGFFGGAGSDVYSSWLDQHLGDTLASTGALGVGDLVRAALGRGGERGTDTVPQRHEEAR